MSFFTGFFVSAIVYYGVNIISPVPGRSTTWAEVDLSVEDDIEQIHHEAMTKDSSEGSMDAKV
jgi:hypothetical protein